MNSWFCMKPLCCYLNLCSVALHTVPECLEKLHNHTEKSKLPCFCRDWVRLLVSGRTWLLSSLISACGEEDLLYELS